MKYHIYFYDTKYNEEEEREEIIGEPNFWGSYETLEEAEATLQSWGDGLQKDNAFILETH